MWLSCWSTIACTVGKQHSSTVRTKDTLHFPLRPPRGLRRSAIVVHGSLLIACALQMSLSMHFRNEKPTARSSSRRSSTCTRSRTPAAKLSTTSAATHSWTRFAPFLRCRRAEAHQTRRGLRTPVSVHSRVDDTAFFNVCAHLGCDLSTTFPCCLVALKD